MSAVEPSSPTSSGAAPRPAPGRPPAAKTAARGRPPKDGNNKASGQMSPQRRALLKLGLARDIDLALHLPIRYDDETRLVRIADARDGSTAQVDGVVMECRVEQRLRRQLVVRLTDGSGELTLRFLHFYPSQQKALAVGTLVRVRGEVRGGFFGREMVHPVFKPVAPGAPLAEALTPVYPASAQLPQAWLRKAVEAALARAPLDEILPPGIVPEGLPTLRDALHALHHPPPGAAVAHTPEERDTPPWQRLKFEELLAQQLSRLQAQRERARLSAPALVAARRGEAPSLPERLLAALPFPLTQAQRRVVREIAHDLGSGQPMHRLLQGDVGSGKTVVAALAAAVAIDAGWQCALMAPTELLASQHVEKLVGWLEPLGVRVVRLMASLKGKGRRESLAAIADGSAQLVVGTHAVIQEKVDFHRLGLAIVDEQHRFGVEQRLALRQKLKVEADPVQAGLDEQEAPGADATALEPHLLMMTATPIPRTLAMSYFADLAVSTIDELPPGRTPVVTKLFSDARRDEVIGRIRDEAARGRQVYWVCPLIEESEALDLRDATETHREVCEAFGEEPPGRLVGLLHGRLPPAEKADVMARFAAGDVAVLVATTVIEVGVDVPNASLMVIEHAERFGLSQLHQLRGRVGRGAAASACVLLYTAPLGPGARERLKAMLETSDGFEIARRDLDIRGPGEFMGARQSGDALLRFADLREDSELLTAAKEAAARLLDAHPEAAARQVERWLASRVEYAKA